MDKYLCCVHCSFFVLIIFLSLFTLDITNDFYFFLAQVLITILLYLIVFNCLIKIDEYYTNTNNDNPIIVNNGRLEIGIEQNPLEYSKVTNINEINHNYNDICPICIEDIEAIDSYKLNICNNHIFHKDCLEIYVNNNFTICPLCNV